KGTHTDSIPAHRVHRHSLEKRKPQRFSAGLLPSAFGYPDRLLQNYSALAAMTGTARKLVRGRGLATARCSAFPANPADKGLTPSVVPRGNRVRRPLWPIP